MVTGDIFVCAQCFGDRQVVGYKLSSLSVFKFAARMPPTYAGICRRPAARVLTVDRQCSGSHAFKSEFPNTRIPNTSAANTTHVLSLSTHDTVVVALRSGINNINTYKYTRSAAVSSDYCRLWSTRQCSSWCISGFLFI